MRTRTRFAHLCAKTVAYMVQRQRIYDASIDGDMVLDIVDAYWDLVHGFATKHLAFYEDEYEEMGDDEAKEICELLRYIKDYDKELQMGESYENGGYRIDLTCVRAGDSIQFNIYDEINERFIDPEDPEQGDWHYGMTYHTVHGEAVNVRIGKDIVTFNSYQRVKGDEEY